MGEQLMVAASASVDDMLLHHEVSQFYYREAQLLDEERVDDWLALIAPEIRYVSSVSDLLMRRNVANMAGQKRSLLFDDDMGDLQLRAARVKTGLVWAEDPPSRMVRQVTNVRVAPGDVANTYNAASIVTVFCCRRDEEEVTIFAKRRDLLRRDGGALRIVAREIQFEHNSFRTGNLSFLL
jgi:3-phenylpropionate/cinnamic acid dioxygenase small subunit